jgi:hypothetical protein
MVKLISNNLNKLLKIKKLILLLWKLFKFLVSLISLKMDLYPIRNLFKLLKGKYRNLDLLWFQGSGIGLKWMMIIPPSRKSNQVLTFEIILISKLDAKKINKYGIKFNKLSSWSKILMTLPDQIPSTRKYFRSIVPISVFP